MQIVDSHVHYWQPSQISMPWLAAQPLLNTPTLTDSVPAGGNGWTVSKIIFVQANVIPEQGIVEAEWVTSLAAQDARIRGIVAFAPLANGSAESRAWLDRLKVLPMVRGIRQLIEDQPVGFAVSPQFIESVQILPEYGYTFDICVRKHQLGEALTLVQSCPNVQFILDHLGKPDIANKEINEWRDQVSAIAAHPNVVCKISGMANEADWQNWTPPDFQPYINHVVSAFGVDRLMFGTDSPMFRLAGMTYAAWVDIAINALSGLSEADKVKVFSANAERIYRI